MVVWLVPVSTFILVAALYLGGFNIQIEGGGGVRQFLGLVLSFVLFLAAYGGLRIVLGGAGPALGGIVLPVVVCVALLPAITKVAFMPVGVKITKGSAH